MSRQNTSEANEPATGPGEDRHFSDCRGSLNVKKGFQARGLAAFITMWKRWNRVSVTLKRHAASDRARRPIRVSSVELR